MEDANSQLKWCFQQFFTNSSVMKLLRSVSNHSMAIVINKLYILYVDGHHIFIKSIFYFHS